MKNYLKKNIKKILIIISMIVTFLSCLIIFNERPTHADSGFSTSHSSSHSSHSSHSSRSRRSGSRSGSGSSSSSRLTPEEAIIVLVIIMTVFIICFKLSKMKIEPKVSTKQEKDIEEKIKKLIPDFNRKEFLDECYKIYCDVQEAWMNFKLEDVKEVISNELYTMYESQLATLEVKGEQNIMKDFKLHNAYLGGFEKQNDTITIKTLYTIEFYDYIAEKETGKLIRGDSKHKMKVVYEMDFRRTLDESAKVDKCPNCGAEVDVKTSKVCPYCRTNLVGENTNWVLTDKKALSQIYIRR